MKLETNEDGALTIATIFEHLKYYGLTLIQIDEKQETADMAVMGEMYAQTIVLEKTVILTMGTDANYDNEVAQDLVIVAKGMK